MLTVLEGSYGSFDNYIILHYILAFALKNNEEILCTKAISP